MFRQFSKLLLILSFFGIFITDAAEILACLSSASRSHHIIQTTILEELARKGHNLTILSTFPSHRNDLPENYHHIHLKLQDTDDWKHLRQRMLNNDEKTDSNQLRRLPKVLKMIVRRSNAILDHEIVQKLMQSNQKFNLFILGYNFNEMMLGLAGHFQVPSVLISTVTPMKSIRDLIGNPAAVSSVPLFSQTDKKSNERLSFLQRFGQFFEYSAEFLVTNLVNFFLIEKSYYERFNGTYPTFDEVKKNVSLVLTNSHFSEGLIRPSLPNLIEIGGVHINAKPNPLPKVYNKLFHFYSTYLTYCDFQNIQDILSNENGVILFSFGGNIQSADLTNEKVQMFFKVFSNLNQTILWKWEKDEIPAEKPDNVFMLPWIPQSDILAQSNIKFFISHCGLGGVYEAKYHGVPILGIPIYGDQLAHAKQISNAGWAKILNIDTLTEIELSQTIDELLSNSSYSVTAKKLSNLFRDRPMKPLDTAIYWIEYIMRHNGAKHMQSSAVHMNFIERNSIDVIIVILFAIYFLTKLIVNAIYLIMKHRTLVVICVSLLSYCLFILFD